MGYYHIRITNNAINICKMISTQGKHLKKNLWGFATTLKPPRGKK